MQILRRLALLTGLLYSANAYANKTVVVSSPDHQIKFLLSADNDGLYYQVFYKGVLMVDHSNLNLVFKEGGPFNRDLALRPAEPERLTEDYNLLIGKTSKVHSESNRVLVPVFEKTGLKRQVDIEIRVFNDGAAFRYVIPGQKQWTDKVNITDELDGFNLTQNPRATVMYRVNYTTSHEGLYTKIALDQLKAGMSINVSALS